MQTKTVQHHKTATSAFDRGVEEGLAMPHGAQFAIDAAVWLIFCWIFWKVGNACARAIRQDPKRDRWG